MERIELRLGRRQRRQLKKEMRKSKDADFRVRCQAVLNYANGNGCSKASQALGCAPSTAIRAVQRYLREGISGLYDKRAENGVAKIDDDLLAAVAEILTKRPAFYGWERPTWTRELIALTLDAINVAEVSVTTVARALAELNAKWKAAKPIVNCPWSKRKKNRRIREIRRVVENLPEGELVFYADEVDIHLNPKVGRDWSLLGKQPLAITPGKNAKRYVAGALDPKTNALVWVAGDRKNSDLFICLLERLAEAYPQAKRIHIVLDNFIIHSSKKTQKVLARFGDKFVLHFLPPYCPDHNKIERLWQTMHSNVTRNHRCKTIEQLMDNVTRWLDLPPEQRTAAGRARFLLNQRRARRPARKFVA
jgi:transposase